MDGKSLMNVGSSHHLLMTVQDLLDMEDRERAGMGLPGTGC